MLNCNNRSASKKSKEINLVVDFYLENSTILCFHRKVPSPINCVLPAGWGNSAANANPWCPFFLSHYMSNTVLELFFCALAMHQFHLWNSKSAFIYYGKSFPLTSVQPGPHPLTSILTNSLHSICSPASRTCTPVPKGFLQPPKSTLLLTQQARLSTNSAPRRPQPMTYTRWCINILAPSPVRREALLPRVLSWD